MIMMQSKVSAVLWVGIFSTYFVYACLNLTEKIKLTGSEVFIPQRLGNLELYKDDDGFYLVKDQGTKNEKIYEIENAFCDQLLRTISTEKLLKFLGRHKPKVVYLTPDEFYKLNHGNIWYITGAEKDKLLEQAVNFDGGYISVNQTNKGDYVLHAQGRLLGDGLFKVIGGIIVGGAVGTGLAVGGVGIVIGSGVITPICSALGIGGWSLGTLIQIMGATFAGVGAAGVTGGVVGGVLATDNPQRPPVNTTLPEGNQTVVLLVTNATNNVRDEMEEAQVA